MLFWPFLALPNMSCLDLGVVLVIIGLLGGFGSIGTDNTYWRGVLTTRCWTIEELACLRAAAGSRLAPCPSLSRSVPPPLEGRRVGADPMAATGQSS